VRLADLVDLAEAASALDVDADTFRKWQQRYDVPRPVKRVGTAGLWLRSELTAWREAGGGPQLGRATRTAPSTHGTPTTARAFTAYWTAGGDPTRRGVEPDWLRDTRLKHRGVSVGDLVYPVKLVEERLHLVTRAVVATGPRKRADTFVVALKDALPQASIPVPSAALRRLLLFRVSEPCPDCGRRGQRKVAVGRRYRFERCDTCDGRGCVIRPPVIRQHGRVDRQTFRQLSEIAHGTHRILDDLLTRTART